MNTKTKGILGGVMINYLITGIIAVVLSIGGFMGIQQVSNAPTFGGPAFTTTQGGTGTSSPYGILIGDQTIRLKTLTIGTGLDLTGTTLSATGATGEANTASSLGTGLNLYDSKSGVVLNFNSLSAGSNITLSTTTNNNTIVISSTATGGSGSGTISTSSAETNTYLPFWTSTAGTPALLSGGSSNLTWNGTKLFANYASTTALTSTGSAYLATAGGNVGIGTTSPAQKLDVWGNLQVGTSSTPTLFVNSATRRVGIGTNNPTNALTVNGSLEVTAGNAFKFDTGSNGITSSVSNIHYYSLAGHRFYLDTNNNTSDNFEIYGNAAEGTTSGALLTVQDTGNVGIGTTSPWGRLSVTGSGATSATYGLVVADSNNSPKMVVRNDGNVGIGTTTPSDKLTINGNGRIENQGQLKFSELRANGNQMATLSASSSMSADVNWTLPASDGTSGQVLTTNGVGNLYFSTPAGGGVWGSITGTLSAQTDLQNALNGKIEQGTTSVSSITALPNLVITKAQVSDFGSYLSSYDAWTHPAAGQSATTSLMKLFGGASTTVFSSNSAQIGGTATTTFTEDGRFGISSSTPWGTFSLENTINLDPFFVLKNNAGRITMLVDDDDRVAINGSTDLAPTPNALLHLTHNYSNVFDPYIGNDLSNSDNYPLLLQNLNSANASSTGIGFTVTNTDGNVGGAIIFKRTNSNSQGELNFYTKQSTTASADPALVMTLTDTGRMVTTMASSTYASTTRQTINQVIDFANGICMGQYSGTTTPNVTIQACSSF